MCKLKNMAELEKYGYPKIELLVRDKAASISKLEFLKSTFAISGDFILLEYKDENNNIICEVFNLNDVKSYKLYMK